MGNGKEKRKRTYKRNIQKKHTKRLESCLCLLCALALAAQLTLPSYAASGTEVKTWQTGDVTATLDMATGTMTLSGAGATDSYKNATSMPWNEDKASITKLVVEEGVRVLGDRLFYGASNLKEVTIAESVTTIGEGVFRACSGLEYIEIPENVTELGRAQFYQCDHLKEAVIKGNITTLNELVFGICTSLETVTFPASLVSQTAGSSSKAAFYKATAVSTIRYGGTREQWQAFLDSNAYTTVLRTDKTEVICSDGSYVYGRKFLSGNVQYMLEDGILTLIGYGAVGDFADAADVPWAEDAATIHTVVIPREITGIGSNVFLGCVNLSEVWYIGSSDGKNALTGSTAAGNEPLLNAAWMLGTEGTCGDGLSWALDLDSGRLVIRGTGAMEEWTKVAALPWRYSLDFIRSVEIGEGVTTLGGYAFSSCVNLTSVTLPSTMEILGTYGFRYAPIESIILPEGVRIIGAKVFSDCASLKEIHLPVSLTNVDMKAFEGCTALKEVYYNGTEVQWNQIEVSLTAAGNAAMLNANVHFLGEAVDVASYYEDIASGDWYLPAVQWLMDYGYLDGIKGTYGAETAVSAEFVLGILYLQAGQPGMYASARDWAENNSLISRDAEDQLSLAELAALLYRTARYNGRDVSGNVGLPETVTGTGSASPEETAALAWCMSQGYLEEFLANKSTVDADAALTGAEASSLLAAYLASSAGTADRYDEIIAAAKKALQAGGDGKLYILVPNLITEGVSSKSGDCQLIIFPDGQTMMIDAGYSKCVVQVLTMLDALELTSLDYFVLSHPHTDHVGGALDVAKHLYEQGGKIGAYYRSSYEYGTLEPAFYNYLKEQGATIVDHVKSQDRLEIGGVTIDIYNPTEEQVAAATASDTEVVNNLSIVMKFNYGSSTYLTCGDLYRSQEKNLAALYGDALKSDVMKTNHHGAYTSNCEEWLTTLSPLIAFSTSDDIGGSVLAEQLPAMGTTYYSAGTDGLILVTMDNNKNYDVISQYDTILRRGYTGTIGKVVSEEEQKPGGGDASTGGDTSIGGDASTGKDASIGGNVATGDASRPLLWLGLMSACGAALLFLLLRRRRENLL